MVFEPRPIKLKCGILLDDGTAAPISGMRSMADGRGKGAEDRKIAVISTQYKNRRRCGRCDEMPPGRVEVMLFVVSPASGNLNGPIWRSWSSLTGARSRKRERPTQKIDLLCANRANEAKSPPSPKFQPWKRSTRPWRTKLLLFQPLLLQF